MELGCEILILIGVPMAGFREGWRGAVAEDAAVETSTGFADWRGDVATAEVKTGLPVWTAACPDVAVIVVSAEAAGRRDAVTTAEEETGFTVCTEPDVLARTGFITGWAVTVTEADTGFITGIEVVAPAEVATAIEGAGAAEVHVETASWVGTCCCIHCWIKL